MILKFAQSGVQMNLMSTSSITALLANLCHLELYDDPAVI